MLDLLIFRIDLEPDGIAGTKISTVHDLRPQSAPMTKAVFEALNRQGFEVVAGLAEADSPEHDFPDKELLVHEVIQGHASCRQVPPGLAGLEPDLAFPFQRFNCFHFDEGDLAVRTAGLTESTLLIAIAIADKSAAGNGLDFKHLQQIGPFVPSDVNRF
jgi:hypothetical protein